MTGPGALELTILMPCLNEAETVEVCVRKARSFLERAGVDGEVLIADNGSVDGSQRLAADAGARVVAVHERGYGSALRAGIQAARGRFVIMGDADDSYDFTALDGYLAQLRAGYQLVMGNRFLGGIEPGAMPPLHRYLGNPVLSRIGKLFFKADVGDFHSGLRGVERRSILELRLRTTGMEFASEMVVRASLADLRITEVPTRLYPDGRTRAPHLRSWRDGWRHLRFLLLYSPRWLFLIPGLLMFGLGVAADIALIASPIRVGSVTFDASTTVYAAALAMIGYQSVLFAVLTKLYALHEGLMPSGQRFGRFARWFTVEHGLITGFGLVVLGFATGVAQVLRWGAANFGHLNASNTIRVAVPAALALVLGMQTIMSSMFVGILQTRTVERVDESSLEEA